MEDILKTAMANVAALADADKVNLKGKSYTMVAQRVQAFRSAAGVEGQILTEIIEQTDQRVLVEASISVWRDGNWSLVANDFAEEYRGQGPVNKIQELCKQLKAEELNTTWEQDPWVYQEHQEWHLME